MANDLNSYVVLFLGCRRLISVNLPTTELASVSSTYVLHIIRIILYGYICRYFHAPLYYSHYNNMTLSEVPKNKYLDHYRQRSDIK